MKTKTLSNQEALNATKRTQYVDKDVVASAPQGTGKRIEFFKLKKYTTAKEVEEEYASYGLTPAPLADLCAYDVKHPNEFDEKKYVATQWKDAQGRFCYLAFGRWRGRRRVRCDRSDLNWGDYWWLAGVPAPRKVSTSTSEAKNSSDTQSLELSEAIARVKEAGYQVAKIV